MPTIELVIASLLGIMTLASVVSQRVKIPYTMVLVLVGAALAALSLSQILGVDLIYGNLIEGGLFVGLVIPPLIFEAMMRVPTTEFRAVVRPAFVLATFGVVISTLVTGILLWQLAKMSLYSSFLFAALISPTDVATVIEVFRRVKVPSRLSTLLETEAAMNDATALVVFSTLLTPLGVSNLTLLDYVLKFVVVMGGGVLVGVLVALGARSLSRFLTDPISETALTIASVYGSYAAATAVGLSGLIAVAIVGLYYGRVSGRGIGLESAKASVTTFWAIAAFFANSIAFLFIGLSTDVYRLASSLTAILTAYFAVTLARAASVYPILAAFDSFGQKTPFKWKNVAMLGGMRGAISIALVATLPSTLAERQLIASMVLGVAFISIMLQGPLLSRYIKGRFREEMKQEKGRVEAMLTATLMDIRDIQNLKVKGEESDKELIQRLEADKERLEQIVSSLKEEVSQKQANQEEDADQQKNDK
ncbi:MAG: cation:proton antiporter [Conexivisphaerales archaeon]